jgi:ribonuclease BN (tRNA processing enzyme)
MNNEFTFQSVGHGLFYTGRLSDGDFNFVYDCGEIGEKKESLKKAIDNYIKNAEDIDFLVVSHLHEDHVCGVYDLHKELKKRGKRIKKIYLPYLDKNRLIIELTIANFLPTMSERDDLSVIFLWWVDLYIYSKDSENKFFLQQNNQVPEPREIESEIITQEKEVEIPLQKDGQPNWYFKMFNRINKNKNESINITEIKERVKELLDGKIRDFFSKKNPQNFRPEIHNGLREIYRKHCSDVNNSSTILIHYPENDNVSFISEDCGYLGCCLHNRYLGCYLCNRPFRYSSCYLYNRPLRYSSCHLYNNLLRCLDRYLHKRLLRYSGCYLHKVVTILTGDAKFDEDMLSKMQDIINNIPNQKNGIKIFQVPHHGGLDNWDSMESMKFNFDNYVISFRCGDIKHPNHKVLFELMSAKKPVLSATQFGEYSYRINF